MYSAPSSSRWKVMTRQMNEYAENMQFEKAAQLRDRIRAIGKISESQKVVFTSVANQDVIALQRTDTETCAVVLKFRTERLVDKQDFLLGAVDLPPGPLAALGEFFRCVLFGHFHQFELFPALWDADFDLMARLLAQ